MSWRELLSMLSHLPLDSALVREVNPNAEWGLPEQLLAAIYDSLAWANYQRSDGKGQKPKPLSRPGVTGANTRHHGKTHLSREEALRILRPDIHDATEGGDDVD